MDLRNYKRLGGRYNKPTNTQIDEIDNVGFDLGIDCDPVITPPSSPSSNSSHSPTTSTSSTTEDIRLLHFNSVIENNPFLTDDYLSGSVLVQENESHDVDPIFSEFLYEGSNLTLEDAILILELIKSTNNLGDTNESIILGMLGSFMPKDNLIKKLMSETTGSIYHFQNLLKKGQQHFQKCSVHKIFVCKNGCTAFVGRFEFTNVCEKCKSVFDMLDSKIKHLYYLPLKDRLIKLLLSDLKNLFHYPILRSKTDEAFIQDIYDGTTWKHFENQMDKNADERLIGLQWCWDGADAFTFSGKSFWPGCFSILNFPKDLRGKLHIGMHVTTLCAGT